MPAAFAAPAAVLGTWSCASLSARPSTSGRGQQVKGYLIGTQQVRRFEGSDSNIREASVV
jgi:hypothetical protein